MSRTDTQTDTQTDRRLAVAICTQRYHTAIKTCLMQTLKINIKSGTEIRISVMVRVPHDIVCVPDVVVDVECKAGDVTVEWMQWSWKDMWKLIVNKWTGYGNIR